MLRRIKKKIYHSVFKEFHPKTSPGNRYHDIQKEEWDIINAVSAFTLTGPERMVSLIRAIDHIEANSIPGSIVECGVWKGGSMMTALKRLQQQGNLDRDIYLYDTFEGMTEPTKVDTSFKGLSASKAFEKKDQSWENIECVSTLEEVMQNVNSLDYPSDKIHFIKGKVEDTIPHKEMPERIAVLRLDTDWYESTLHEMEHLFPKIVSGGILIIDDYGHWKGCKQAVDEYIARNNLKLFLARVDYTCRIGVKQ